LQIRGSLNLELRNKDKTTADRNNTLARQMAVRLLHRAGKIDAQAIEDLAAF